MTDSEILMGLNFVPGIKREIWIKLFEHFGSLADILKEDPQDLAFIAGMPRELALRICSLQRADIEREFELAKGLGLKIVTIKDALYPENLKQIYDPPPVLYIKGNLSADDNLSVAVVGSRAATYYGLSCAERISGDLSRSGLTVVSGMARGIDTASHRGALKSGGRTLAVMGSGFNHIYPKENQGLIQEIAASGAVVSEFPINIRPTKMNFPRRNRIISGLSLGVVVIEAARNSGALITSEFALEQGRDVFAVPGRIDSPNSSGTNKLIQEGAKLVKDASGIIEELSPILISRLRIRQENVNIGKVNLNSSAKDLDQQEQRLYKLISRRPMEIEAIVEELKLPVEKVFSILTLLEVDGRIRQLPGKIFQTTGLTL
ncbi:MAG: DNA-processing protein DprA [Candidatus Omnitrophota bacterium]|nr:DNA-processing protein DprA [Candidatus Omnitrophota bacterium]